ncbi:xanthine dehydrogenase accessory protein XdhC [Tropicimonas sp. IMCC34043]|uniref:xanthine dehydrogenase accessory protein XdhC n=1 Tax=Tropicimonas sp. IMCC34043 TaxID=2248760 RepID=UPI000E24B96B|nr:xanthine dehydrogenase accessory protein XdhC [Tropicimonas sp. IMCC34043]
MSFDHDQIRQAIAAHGRVVRVVVAEAVGSAPREAGASMLVWQGGQSGTIGGGALEWLASERARLLLAEGGGTVARLPLGPALGQCCGGAVTLVSEVLDADRLAGIAGAAIAGHVLRPVGPGAVTAAADAAQRAPFALRRLLAAVRNGSAGPVTRLVSGWLVEPLARRSNALWLHGAGHVGRAIADVFAPLPDWQVTWVDTAPDRFPEAPPLGVDLLVAVDPVRAIPHAPVQAHHLILTYSHEIDFALCHALLGHGFASAGLIGSATKWARFRKRLGQLGHSEAEIARIACPIGDPSFGKHPQAIAIGVAARLLSAARSRNTSALERSA